MNIFKNFIQIAGVLDEAEAEMLMDKGTKYIGIPLRLDYHKEDVNEKEAISIVQRIKSRAEAVLITYENKAYELKKMLDSLHINILQIHGYISINELSLLKKISSDTVLIKSLVIESENTDLLKSTINDLSKFVDAYITDTFDPLTGARGATGKTHDWAVSRALVEHSPRPVILAGGLNPENVRAAILEVGIAGVDVHTGVEDKSGRKEGKKVSEFIKNAQQAFKELS